MGEFDEANLPDPVANAAEQSGAPEAGVPQPLALEPPIAAEPAVAPAEEPTELPDEIAAIQEQLALDVPLVVPAPAETPERTAVLEMAVPEVVAPEAPDPAAAALTDSGMDPAFAVMVAAAAAAATPAAIAEPATPAVAEGPPALEPEPSGDDLEAALEAASEQIGVEPTLDDIAPGTKHADDNADAALEIESTPRFGAPWWPFLVYLVMWIALVGLGVWQLTQLPASQVAFESQPYSLFMYGGLIMAAVGPILVLAVWLATWLGSSRHRAGLFSSAFFKGAMITAIGVAMWWGGLMVVDYLRLGRTF